MLQESWFLEPYAHMILFHDVVPDVPDDPKDVDGEIPFYIIYKNSFMLAKGTFGTVFIHNETTVRKEMDFLSSDEKGMNICNLNELILLHILDHDHIVTCKKVMVRNNRIHMFMERGEQTLFDWSHRTTWDDRLHNIKDICKQILCSLCYLHFNQIIHGDLKPNNIIRRKDGLLQLIDFGGAVLKDLQTRYVNCTQAFSAPETQKQRRPHMEFTSDIFSVGLILLYLLTGKYYVHEVDHCVTVTLPNKETFQSTCFYDTHAMEKQIQFLPVVSDTMKQMMRSMLHLDFRERPNVFQLLSHPYFGMTQEQYMFHKRPITKTLYVRKSKDNDVLSNRELVLNHVFSLCEQFTACHVFPFCARLVDHVLSSMNVSSTCIVGCAVVCCLFPVFGIEYEFPSQEVKDMSRRILAATSCFMLEPQLLYYSSSFHHSSVQLFFLSRHSMTRFVDEIMDHAHELHLLISLYKKDKKEHIRKQIVSTLSYVHEETIQALDAELST